MNQIKITNQVLKYSYLLAFMVVISVFSGCKPDEPANWTRYEYLNEARDYIYFKTGTQWVYKRIPGGELDTIEVFDDWIDTITLTGKGNVMYYEDVSWKGKSRMDNYTYKFFQVFPPPVLDYDLISPSDVVWKRYFISKSRPGSYMGQTNVITYPFTDIVLNNGHSHETKMLDDIDTITIQGIQYRNVKHIDVSNDATFIYDDLGRSGGIVQYYWAPNIGIIKKEHMTKNIAWELVESRVVQ